MARKFRFPIKRSPRSDPQQYRVYRMENEAIGARTYLRLSRAAIRKFVRSVCRNYGVPLPHIVWQDLGRWGAEWDPTGDSSTLRFSTRKRTSRDLLTVTHELAHHLHYWLEPELCVEQQSHGSAFMACHISILDTCRVIPVVGMRAICAAWKVEYVDPGSGASLARLKAAIRKGR